MKSRKWLAVCMTAAALTGPSQTPAQAPAAPAAEAAAPAAAATPAPVALPPAAPIDLAKAQAPADLAGCMLVVRVPNLRGTLATAEAVLQKGMPGVPLQLTSMVADKLQDPGLAGFPDGAGIAMVVPDAPDAHEVTVFEIAADQRAAFEGRMKAQGMATETVGELLAMADTPQALQVAHAYIEKNAAALMGDGGQTGLVAEVNMAAIIRQHGADIEAKIASIPAELDRMQAMQSSMAASNPGAGPAASTPIPSGAGKAGEFEARIAYSVFKEIDTARVALDLNAAGLSVVTAFKALPGTNLAALNAAPQPEQDTKIASLIPGGGAITLAVTSVNCDAIIDYITARAKAVSVEMKLAEADYQPLIDFISRAKTLYGGSLAASIAGTGSILDGAFVVDCPDATAGLAFVESFPEAMKLPGMVAINKMAGQTVSISFQKNAREYNGVAIHKLTEDIKYDNPAAQAQAQAMLGMNGHLEFEQAFVGRYLVQSSGATKIETLIDAVKAGANPAAKPLRASTDFAAGTSGVLDMDLGSIMQKFAQAAAATNPQAAAPMMMITGMFGGTPPVTSAWKLGGDADRKGLLIPAELITRVGGQAMMFAAMAGGAGGPGGPGMAPGGPGMAPGGPGMAPGQPGM